MDLFSYRNLFFGGIFLAFSLSAIGEENPPPLKNEEEAILTQAQLASRAFAIVAQRVLPAVVHLKVERVRTVAVAEDPFSLFDELLSRRFGPSFGPSFPRRRRFVEQSQGSGVIVDPRGYILTNHHVVGNADKILVKLSDGRSVPGELVGSSPESDVAVVRIEADRITVAPMGDSDDCMVGEWVLAIGSPFGLESTVTSGIISAKGRSGVRIAEYEDFIQTDAAINAGNSGGPLLNLKGEVIGINTAILSGSGAGGFDGIGFAIPINIARTLMNGIIANKRMMGSYLGAHFQTVTPEIAEQFGLPAARGVLLTEVLADTPAARAGLRRGDIILRFGKREITDEDHLRTLVATTSPGKEIEIEFLRGHEKKTTRVTIEAIPEEVILEFQSRRLLDDLGLGTLVALTPAIAKEIGYPPSAEGVLVLTIKPRSQAHRMGLVPGSLILQVDETEVKTPEELRAALGKGDLRKGIKLIWRSGAYLRSVLLRGK